MPSFSPVEVGPSGGEKFVHPRFFNGPQSSDLGPEDVLAAVRFSLPRAWEGFAFAEVARRHGDFALAGVAIRARCPVGRWRRPC